MAKKWSESSGKPIVSLNDQMLIIDSEDPNPTTKNRLITLTDLISGIQAVFGQDTIIGEYDAGTNTPDLDVTPIPVASRSMFVVSQPGLFFTAQVERFDALIAKNENPTTEAEWSIIQGNLTDELIKIAYEANANTNAFTDSDVTNLSNAVLNPSGATDEALVRWDTDSGKLVQDSVATLSNTGDLTVRTILPTSIEVVNQGTGANSIFFSDSSTNRVSLTGDLFISQSLDVETFITIDNAFVGGGGQDPVLFSSSPDKELTINNKLSILNIGAGANPVFSSNSLGQILDLAGTLEISDNLVIDNKGVGGDPFFSSNSGFQVLSLTGTLDVSDDIIINDILEFDNQGAGGNPKLSSDSSFDRLRLDGELEINGTQHFVNQSTGADPILLSNATTQELDLVGDFKISKKLTITNQGSSTDPFFLSNDDFEQTLTLFGELDISQKLIVGTNLSIVNDGTGFDPILFSNSDNQEMSLTGDFVVSGNFTITNEYVFDTNKADWKQNDLTNVRLLSFIDSAVNITEVSGNMLLDVPVTKFVDIRVGGNGQYAFGDGIANWLGNAIENVLFFESNAANTASAEVMRFGNNQKMAWRDPTNLFDVTVGIDATNYFNIFDSKGINLQNNDKIRWDSNDARRIANDGLGFIFDVEVNDTYDFKIADNDEYVYNATQADFKGNSLVGVLDINASGTLDLVSGQQIRWAGSDGRVIFNTASGFGFEVQVGDTFNYIINTQLEYLFNATESNFFGNNLIGLGYQEFDKISVPADPFSEEGRLYLRQVDGSNNALFIKIKQNGNIVEVQLS